MSTAAPRPAGQAGRFYEADPERLRNEVEHYIEDAPDRTPGAKPVGFVSPHAGYIFSGPTAGHTWRQIRALNPSRVFILAPSHHASFPAASVWNGPAYTTPLGECPIDRQAADALARHLPDITCHEEAELAEHALEVQIPFLQVACPDAQIVPMLVGSHGPRDSEQLAEGIAVACDDLGIAAPADAVFVASSDAYHGYSEHECLASDDHLARAVETLDADTLYSQVQTHAAQACGLGPIAAVMRLARHFGATEGVVLDHATSADAMPGRGSGDYVVGYLSVMFA